MQAKKGIIEALNNILGDELTSINHYFLHARMFKNWGFSALDKVNFKKSIKDMKQADELIERILLLEGLPNLQHLNPLRIGEHTEEMLASDIQFQSQTQSNLRSAIATCELEQDYVSRDMLTEILEHEEEHTDWIETQQYQITKMGIQNYLQAQISEEG
ncbi:MAG: bacterioferritin [Alteromonadaceae bacterium]|nr:MAG: bacterioferritin [Alteromonadaceae bacterium]